MDRTHTYRVERLNTGVKRLVNSTGCCGQTEGLIGTDGGRTLTFADGTVVTQTMAPDPRWGMLAPLVKLSTISTPGGLQSITERTRAVTLVDPDDLLSLETLTDTVTTNGRTYTSIYDAAQRQFTETSPEGRQTFDAIDMQGRPVKEQIAGLPHAVFSSYDPQGRLEMVKLGPGNDPAVDRVDTTDYNAQGYLKTITDPLGHSVDFAYDDAGRVTAQEFSDGRQITFTFDPNGNLESITPPGNPPHAFAYTPVNELEVELPPVLPDVPNPATDYDYNLDRNLENITRPDGLTIDPVYDFTKDRLERQILPGGREIIFDYYDGDPSGEPDTGQLKEIRVQPDNVSISYTYDGSLFAEKIWGGVIQGAVGLVHDNDFRIQSLYVNSVDFFRADFVYDDDGLLSRVDAGMSAGPLAVDLLIARNSENDLVTGTTLSNITTTQSYNGFGELAAYSASHNGAAIFGAVYDTAAKPRDKLGRITDLSETVADVTTSYHYEYDEADRLADVWMNGQHVSHYSYDANGNRRSHTNPSNGTGITPADVQYDNQDRLLQYGDITFAYTPNGELLTKTENSRITSYDYDVLGNLRSVTLPDGPPITYIIDGLSRRIGKKINGALVQGFLYQDDLNPVAEFDGGHNVLSVFVYADGVNVPDYMVSKKEDGATWVAYRIISDHLGSPRLVVNSVSGQIVQRLDYDEFGNVINDTNPGFQPFGFAGGFYDPQTGLTRFGARDYDAFTGRWIAKDPAGFAGGGTNLYSYVSNDSINQVDLTGIRPQLPKLPSVSPMISPKPSDIFKSQCLLDCVMRCYLKNDRARAEAEKAKQKQKPENNGELDLCPLEYDCEKLCDKKCRISS
jgi:RHS repeat-associated protein